LAHTVTLVANHKGFTRPRVLGDEYVVDASIDIVTYTTGGVVITAASLGLKTINTAFITRIPGGLAQHSFILVDGASNGDTLYLEVNVEDGTSGKEAQLANANGSLSGTPLTIRVHGQL
jgi:hypothetical protein